ncbi:hypothetical protein M409DRAFT_56730 [Zasmidium cellare ATCC 36951]|uniref:Heterokaryon incompatibility domain-containing protein n=1 Tax=Zasmidium cellare ATCC 36951 TaxID=1080233 RepID=A0A6A6CFM1_ZASCE|nr:uncharacterized protein M409DRAFT_56730 [Zasmidium cellare ATCC 36951]KAF2164469.1 hypothetical protein M409DRAFT_56730 [Zasmidium cellare ATCC 36951]
MDRQVAHKGDSNRNAGRTEWQQLDDATLHRLNEESRPEIAPHTCSFCQKLCIDANRNGAHLMSFENGKETAVTLAECVRAARNDCVFCVYLLALDGDLRGLSLETVAELVAISKSRPILCAPNFDKADDGPYLYVTRNLWTDQGDYQPYIRKFQLYTAPKALRSHSKLASGNMHTEQLLNGFLPPNLLPDSYLSERRARRWLAQCEHSHSRCRARQGTFRPKRLLEISRDGQVVRLQHDHATSTRYVTLSYCWGGNYPGKATKANIHALRHFFNAEDLPASIRDGVKMASKLGFHFIWVDALCIVQDDDQDISEQIAQIHKIYTSSTLTIAASSALNSWEGFLHARTAWRPSLVNFRSYSGELVPVLAVPTEVDRDRFINTNPLFTRAWAYQEIQVTTRVLSFGSRNTAFFCRESEHMDGGSYKLDFGNYLKQGVSASGFLNAGMKSLDSARHPKAWTDIVTTYTELGLSVASDKLPALAALAEEYGKRLWLTKYLAGLWAEDLQWQLMWERASFDSPTTRPPIYCGPSWSWCSVVGPITFRHDYKKLSDLELLCSTEAASTTPCSGNHIFGQVSRGTLILKGRTRDLIWLNRQDGTWFARVPESRSKKFYGVGPLGADRRLEVKPDVPSEWPPDTEIALRAVEIVRFRDHVNDRYDWKFTRALLLHRVEGDDVYRRAGMLHVDIETGKDEDWFDEGSTMMEVTIV